MSGRVADLTVDEFKLLLHGLREFVSGKTTPIAVIRTRAKVESAIETIRTSMGTHKQWAEFIASGHKVDKARGDEHYHRRTFKEYEQVLEVLLLMREALARMVQ